MSVGLKTGSSAGQQRKQLIGDYLVKYDNVNCREGLSEVITSRFLDLCEMPFSHIRYTPYKDDIGVGCKCAVNKAMLLSSCSVKHYLQRTNAFSLHGASDFVQLYNMIVCDLCSIPCVAEYFKYLTWIDTVVQNVDRHWGNINIILDEDKPKFSPFFDFGASLSFDIPDYEYFAGICAGINRSRCSLLHSDFMETYRIITGGRDVSISFKGSKLKIDDLCKIYPEGAVMRTLDIININIKLLGFSIKVQPK